MLRRRVLGDVFVVPRLACRRWPARNEPGIAGEPGVTGEPGVAGDSGVVARLERWSKSEPGVASAPDGKPPSSTGVAGFDAEPANIALPSSDSASTRSGGSRSFSMSDLRLNVREYFVKPRE
jgi:hypothetical protein